MTEMPRYRDRRDAIHRKIKSPAGRITRRQAVLALAGIAASQVIPLPLLPRSWASESTKPHKLGVGDAEVVVLSDGYLELPVAMVLPDRKPDEARALLQASGDSVSFRAAINVTLVKTGRDVVLIDTGGGSEFVPSVGQLADNLARIGTSPDDITAVIFTHAHPDHFWGIIDPLTGDPLFPSARLYMSKVERDYWLASARESDVPESFRGIALGIKRRLTELGDRITVFNPGQEPVAGLLVVDTAGHTPGHVSVHLSSKGESLLIGGDVLTHGVVSFANPAWRWGTDVDGDRAIQSRKRTLDMLATDKVILQGYHLPWPGVGRVERAEAGYRFVAL